MNVQQISVNPPTPPIHVRPTFDKELRPGQKIDILGAESILCGYFRHRTRRLHSGLLHCTMLQWRTRGGPPLHTVYFDDVGQLCRCRLLQMMTDELLEGMGSRVERIKRRVPEHLVVGEACRTERKNGNFAPQSQESCDHLGLGGDGGDLNDMDHESCHRQNLRICLASDSLLHGEAYILPSAMFSRTSRLADYFCNVYLPLDLPWKGPPLSSRLKESPRNSSES